MTGKTGNHAHRRAVPGLRNECACATSRAQHLVGKIVQVQVANQGHVKGCLVQVNTLVRP